MLSVSELTVFRSGHAVIGPISLEVRPGQILGLIGPNGCGKTSLIAALLSVLPHVTGQFELQAPASRVGVVWQQGGLPLAVGTDRWTRHLSSIYGCPVNAPLLSRLGLSASRKSLREHSGGEQRRWALYAALAHRPSLLVFDEPTVGLDDAYRAVFYELMREHQQVGGAALITSHAAQDIALLNADVLRVGGEHSGYALFATDRPLELSAVPQIRRTDTGYLLLTDEPDPLTFIDQLTRAQSAVVISYVRL